MLEVLLFLCQYELLSWIFQIWIFIPQLRRITLKLCQVALRIKNSVFIIYLLEDEQELSLGMLIRLQRIYNFWLLHAILSTVLDVYGLYYTLLYYLWHYLLTGGPAQIAVFLPISVFRRKGKSNGVQLTWNFTELIFGRKEAQKTWSARQERNEGATR